MDYPPDQRRRCKTCGYLAQRLTISAFEPALREVNEKQRSAWGGEIVIPGQSTAATTPTCYVRAFNLEAEYDSGNSAEMVKRMFDKDRNCPKWYPYIPGFSPKEHLERYQAAQAEQERRQFAARLEVDRKRFEWRMQKSNWVFQAIVTLFLALIALLSVPWFSKWLLGR
jgi:hypothetical protein